MNIEIKRNTEEVILVVSGRLDTTTAPTLDKTLCDVLNEVRNIVLDIKELEYISSAGLRVLLSAQKKMNKIGSMKLTGVCEEVMEVFEMTGFADILDIEQNVCSFLPLFVSKRRKYDFDAHKDKSIWVHSLQQKNASEWRLK